MYVTVKGNVPLITKSDLTLITEGNLALVQMISMLSTLAKIFKFTSIV